MKTATLIRFKDYSQAKTFCHVLTDPIYDAVRVPSSFDGAEAHDPMQHEQKLTAYCYGVLVEFEGSNAEEIAAAYARQAIHVVARRGQALIGLPTPSRFIVLSDIASVRLKQITLHDCQSHEETKDNPPKVYGRRTTKALSRLQSDRETLSMEPVWTVVYRYGMSVLTWNGDSLTGPEHGTKYMTRPEAMAVWKQIRGKWRELFGAEVAQRILIARKS